MTDLGFEGRGAVVTGASRGLGMAIARRLADSGATVCVVARDMDALNGVVETINQEGGKAFACPADLTRPEDIARLIEECRARLPSLDALANCAGATKRGDFFELTDADWQSGYDLKLFGTVRVCRALWPLLKAAQGSIVNIAGLGDRMPEGEFAIGGSVNAALLNFTKALADVGVRDGVRVNAINPGFIETGRLVRSLEGIASRGGTSQEEAGRLLLERLGVTRFGRPDEVAALASFMMSRSASYLNGSAVELDGGARRPI